MMNRMSSDNSSSNSGGIGFLGLLAVLFIGLKLTEYIDWSWWWVLSPLWIPFAIMFGFIGIVMLFVIIGLFLVGICLLVAFVFETVKDRRKLK